MAMINYKGDICDILNTNINADFDMSEALNESLIGKKRKPAANSFSNISYSNSRPSSSSVSSSMAAVNRNNYYGAYGGGAAANYAAAYDQVYPRRAARRGLKRLRQGSYRARVWPNDNSYIIGYGKYKKFSRSGRTFKPRRFFRRLKRLIRKVPRKIQGIYT